MEYQVKAAVIGGGPAGCAAALSLQKYDEKNCIIDRAVFPRDKACAGLVTDKTYKLLKELLPGSREDTAEAVQPDDLLSSMFCRTISEVSVFDRYTLAAKAGCDVELHLAYRSVFDNVLVTAYKNAGGLMFEGQKDYSIDYENNLITLPGGDSIRYEYLIFADGALSRAHKDFHIKRRSLAFSAEVFIPAALVPADSIEIHFGLISPGYVWLFPYGDMVSVGIGAISTPEKSRKCMETLKEFVKELKVPEDGLKYRGAYVPFGHAVDQSVLPGNVILAGDAGGFADPIYGEGLYMALFTGMAAASAIAGPENDSPAAGSPKNIFLNNVQPLYRMIKSGMRLQKFLYSPPIEKIFLKKMRGRERFLKFYCDRQVSSYGYSHTDLKLFKDYKKTK